MVSTKTVIRNPMGMHMRPAGMFANAMMKFIAACIKCGTEVEVQCSGPDEEAALLEAVRLIENGLGE